MKRFAKRTEPWGEYVDAKVNAHEVLERDIGQLKKDERGTVLLSSVCDPYQPAEAKHMLTRRILAILLNKGFPVSILTKSSLVSRDIDLFKAFRDIDVGMTTTGLKEYDRRKIEPLASSHEDRINTLRGLNREGIRTYAFIGPILPGLSDIERIFRDLEGIVDYAFIDNLNLKHATWIRIKPFMAKNYPELLPLYQRIYQGDNSVWNDIWAEVGTWSKKYGIKTVL
jgi:DNA repair photolyase